MPEPVFGTLMETGARTAEQAREAREAEERANDPVEQIKNRRATAGDLLDGGAAIRAEVAAVESRAKKKAARIAAEAKEVREELTVVGPDYEGAIDRALTAASKYISARENLTEHRARYDALARRARELGVAFTPVADVGVRSSESSERGRQARQVLNKIRTVGGRW